MINGKKILIENCAGIGDIIMFTPFLRALKQTYPKAEITILTKKINTYAINRLPYIDHVYDNEGCLGDWGTAKYLWDKDWCIFTTWQPQMVFLTKLFNIKHRVSRFKAKYEKSNLIHKWIYSWVLDRDEFAAQIIADELNKVFGTKINIEPHCDVSLPNSEENKRFLDLKKRIINEGFSGIAAIAPYTSRKDKDISSDLINQTIEYLIKEKNIACLLFGSDNNQAYTIKEKTGLYNLLGKTSLFELVAGLKYADLAVVGDSGPNHISCALGTPTVAIFTRVLPSMWAPRENCFPVRYEVDCCPCNNETGDICEHHRCQTGITFSMIKKELEKIIV